MPTQTLHRGRMLDHLQLVTDRLEASRRFYTAVFAALQVPLGGESPEYFWYDELFVSTRQSAAARGELTGRVHLAFQAASRDMVDQFYRAALAAGGTDDGPPGERQYHPGYYAAFVRDPDGNNIEAVFHRPAQRSAASVTLEFSA